MSLETAQPAKSRKWYEIWWDVWSHPGVTSFKAVINEPNMNLTRVFIWLGVSAVIAALISNLVTSQYLDQSISTQVLEIFRSWICAIIGAPLSAIIGMVISAGIYHWITKLFGGNGKWRDLVSCLSTVMAPSTLIGGALGLISILLIQVLPIVFIISLISAVVGIYTIILFVNAIRVAEGIGTGGAIITVLSPIILIGILFLCIILALIPSYRVIS